VNDWFKEYFFNTWILLLMDAYFQIAISGLLYYMLNSQQKNAQRKHDSYSQDSQNAFGVVCLILSCIVLPILVLGVLFSLPCAKKITPKKLQGMTCFKRMFGGLLMDTDKKKSMSTIYPIVFVYRRLVLVLAIVFLHFEAAISWTLIITTNMLIQFYLVKVKPLETRALNRQELINELLIFYVAAFMSVITDYTFSLDLGFTFEEILDFREFVGWIIIVLMLCTIFVNISINLNSQLQPMKFWTCRCCVRYNMTLIKHGPMPKPLGWGKK
jgi:hypothetical protein